MNTSQYQSSTPRRSLDMRVQPSISVASIPVHQETLPPPKNLTQIIPEVGAMEFGAAQGNPTRAVSDAEAERLRGEIAVQEDATPMPMVVEEIRPISVSPDHSFAGRHRARAVQDFQREQRSAHRRARWQDAREYLKQVFIAAPRMQWFQGVVGVLLFGLMGWWGISLVQSGLRMKGEVLGVSQQGVDHLQSAVQNLKHKDTTASEADFEYAAQAFGEASQHMDEWNQTLVHLSEYIPGVSRLASGRYAVEAGQHFALAGKALNESVSQITTLRGVNGVEGLPLLQVFQTLDGSTRTALGELRQAQSALDHVQVNDLPEDKRDKFIEIKQSLPMIIDSMQLFVDHGAVLTDLFGGNGPRKYLFLLQNNQEARATGGFIGTYALLDINQGRVRQFFVDGIFNPDGQLTQNIVPPQPLQKVSGAWSMHDSNWFPDFPLSAEKAILFYEKTGGPTVDGVITLTPTVIQKLLAISGPITLDEYGVTLDEDNFTALVQDQVEFKYDKEENKPKKILSDMMPVLLDKLLAIKDPTQVKKIVLALEASLNEKHILLYARQPEMEQLIRTSGWSGEIIDASKDYLSVINTNINGYKTDGVIEQSIEHQAVIGEDGAVTNTVTITRRHTGGATPYEFWNKVNVDYMRVLVPEGAQLISATGQTREQVEAPLDYEALKFTRDADVVAEEASIHIDQATGTRIYHQSHKTVFANWVYVSPGETATMKYVYRLPFRVTSTNTDGAVAGSYSVIFQKQSGALESKLISTLRYPDRYRLLWQTEGDLTSSASSVRLESDLRADRFYGIVLGY